MKDIVESLAGLAGAGQVELALLTLLILALVFRPTVRVLLEVIAHEQTPLRKLVRAPLIALVFTTAIILAVAVAMYGLLR